ncbi:MAG: hypothetical protein HQL75_05305 [Magnetococcales bacterium]|nr:hypothetical protein [Magnetococcales bacterium]
MIQRLTTLNWVVGTVFFLVAIVLPILDQEIFEKDRRDDVEKIVKKLLDLEQDHYKKHGTFIYFAPGKMPDDIRTALELPKPDNPDFAYEVFASNDGAGLRLNIHAHASNDAIKAGQLPAITYALVWDNKSPVGQWDLPVHKYGIFYKLF